MLNAQNIQRQLRLRFFASFFFSIFAFSSFVLRMFFGCSSVVLRHFFGVSEEVMGLFTISEKVMGGCWVCLFFGYSSSSLRLFFFGVLHLRLRFGCFSSVFFIFVFASVVILGEGSPLNFLRFFKGQQIFQTLTHMPLKKIKNFIIK